MSLSVEELKALEHQLEQDLFNLNIGCLSAYGRSDQIRKELAAIRELIAIKEQSPVAEVSYHRFKQLTWLTSSDDLESGTQLIRKPE